MRTIGLAMIIAAWSFVLYDGALYLWSRLRPRTSRGRRTAQSRSRERTDAQNVAVRRTGGSRLR